MDRVYRSKIDWWLGLIIGIGLAAILLASVALLTVVPQGGSPAAWIAVGLLLMAGFMTWVLFSVSYVITATELLVRAAFFRWRVPLEQIVEVFPTHNPLSSPALSLDRLRVNYVRPNGKIRWIMISPKEKQQFLNDLAKAANLEKVGNRLVRRG